MVIAIMGDTFGRVEEDREAILWREKLIAILDKFHMFDSSLKEQFLKSKYLLQIEVDPEIDPIAEESRENRIKKEIHSLRDNFVDMKSDQDTIFGHILSLHDQISKFDKYFAEGEAKLTSRLSNSMA